MWHRLAPTLTRHARPLLWSMAFLPLLAIYLATATWHLPYHVDAFTNVIAARQIGAEGSLALTGYESLTDPDQFGNTAWIVSSPRGPASQYPPGTALLAAPLYALHPSAPVRHMSGDNNPSAPPVDIPVPSLAPAAVTAATATAAAMATFALVFFEFVAFRIALAAAYVAGIGSGAWAVASGQLWQHGPAMLWIALALLLVARERNVWAGIAFGLAILTRPHLGVVAASTGLWAAASRRSARPAVQVAFGSTIGLAALVGYNWLVFGAPSISGGYGPTFASRFLVSDPLWYLRNVVGALFDPQHGLLLWAPFLIILAPGLGNGWRKSPDWVRGAAVGGLLYVLIQLKANRFSGGAGFFGYRYPLEALAATAPLLLATWSEWIPSHSLRRRLFNGSVVLAVAGQAIGAVLY